MAMSKSAKLNRIKVSDPKRLEQIQFIGITSEKLQRINEQQDVLAPFIPEIVNRLYEEIYMIESLGKIIDEYSTLERLKRAQCRYLEQCLTGMIDDTYIEDRLTIGKVHSKIGLNLQWYLATYAKYINVITEIGQSILHEKLVPFINALQALFSFDMQLTMEAYNEFELDRAVHPLRYELKKIQYENGLTDEDLICLDEFSGLISFQASNLSELFQDLLAERIKNHESLRTLLYSKDYFIYISSLVVQFFQERVYRKPEIFYRLIQDWSRLIINNKISHQHFQMIGDCLEEALKKVFLSNENHSLDPKLFNYITAFDRLYKFIKSLIQETVQPYQFLQNFQFLDVYAYEISSTDFGRITWVNNKMQKLLDTKKSNTIFPQNFGSRCYELIFNRAVPCTECPLLNKRDHATLTLEMEEKVPHYYKVRPFSVNNIFDLSRSLLVMQDTTKESKILFDTLDRLLKLAEFRDDDTGTHVYRIGVLSGMLAKLIGKDEQFVENISLAARFHDIGKVGIPDSILNKPAKLTNEEWESMKTHSLIGHRILSNLELPVIQMAATIAYTHHEWWNGKGYPNGIAGEAIPLEGRIVAIVDVFDALLSKRVYKDALSAEKVKKILEEGRGRQFDPYLLDLFLKMWEDFLECRTQLARL
ncbi:HD domain-containing phosphohydrolase [Pseudobacillus wudalianchiensis]|nr:HD domain-containing phosphohydrolase [Bacillus wudalianchiensis]